MVHTFRFTHAVRRSLPGRTRHAWRVSRNFALGEQAGRCCCRSSPTTTAECGGSSRRCRHRPRRRTSQEINVSADAAALQVRKIIRNMVADETGVGFRQAPATRGRPTPKPPILRFAFGNRAVIDQTESGEYWLIEKTRALRIANLRIPRPVAVRGGQHGRTELLGGLAELRRGRRR